MDIGTGLTLIGQATGIVKSLREIEKGFDLAALKAQMAELYGTLADVKIALSDAREELHDRDQAIKKLQSRIEILTSGEACPLCEEGRLKVTASRAHPQFAFAGVQERTITCSQCGHSEKRLYDPENITGRR